MIVTKKEKKIKTKQANKIKTWHFDTETLTGLKWN